ncbi:unnamed protein product [Dicrocoelium dendriticum]|nr:unnamed protein product [Dicrocoelium dendriticum]
MALCVPKQPSSQSTEDWNSYVRRVILSDPDDLCIQVRWAIDGQTRGLVGLLVVVLAERPPDRSTTVRHPQNMTKVYEGIQRSLKDCIRMLWVPCDNCLGPYSLINAHQQVWNRLFQLVDLCDSTFRADGLTSPTNRGLLDSSSPFANTNSPSRTDELLKLLARSTTTRILMNQTTVDLLLKVSKNIVIEEADLSLLSPRFSRSAVQFPPQPAVQNRFRITDIEQGIVQFYMVSANNVTLLAHQQWRLPSKGSASGQMNAGAIAGLIFGILFVLGLLAALSLLIVFNAKRVNRMRHSALQRVEDYGGLADSDDEEAAMCLEMKQPILPPKIAKFLMRPPDPISVHEFTLWCSRHSLNDYQSLRQEFKHLQIHAMRQEQAKRLTRQVGQRPENRLRNKYRNLVPFDHNYVHLLKSWRMVDIIGQPTPTNCPIADASANHCEAPPVEKVETASLDSDNKLLTEEHWIASDYVNASLVPGRAPGIAYCLVQSNLLPRTYIAAQAPVKQTRVLFWQMIWDHGVKLILTLTRLVEGPKEKCVQYWPGPADDAPSGTDSSDEKVLQLGHFTITLLQCVSNAAVVKRKFSVQNSLVSGGPPRIVVQLHMMRWPDFSAPSPVDFTSLLFTYWTERRCTSSDAPVLIHCSAGIGRTGTFICLDQLCHQARYYLQPDFQPWNMHPTCKTPTNLDEPVYVNLKFDSEETANSSANNHRVSGLSAAASEPCGDEYPNGGSQTAAGLLSGATRNNDTRSNTARRRRFGLGRRKSHCIDIYKIVLWLRSNRSYMVQSEEQYLFIYQYLSYFIQKVNDSEQIYVNV